jgi:hypothetical protein
MTTAAELASYASSFPSFRNRIINGDMRIDQRNAGVSSLAANATYYLDRWVFLSSQNNKFNIGQNLGSATPPTGFTNYLGLNVASAVSVASGDYFSVAQKIEGFNVADLGWGTANAKTVTLSFQVYSSLVGTFGGVFRNSSNARAYPFTYIIPPESANTWTSISVTVVGDATGTWNTNSSSSIEIWWNLGAGSTFSTTAGAWAAGNFTAPTGATSVVGTSGATFYITGVQLEEGTVATPFEHRPYGTELALCQRYCQRNARYLALTGYQNGSSQVRTQQPLVATLRAAPSVSYSESTIPLATTGATSFTHYTISSVAQAVFYTYNGTQEISWNLSGWSGSDNNVCFVTYGGILELDADL